MVARQPARANHLRDGRHKQMEPPTLHDGIEIFEDLFRIEFSRSNFDSDLPGRNQRHRQS